MGTIKRIIGKKSAHIAKNINLWATEGAITFNAEQKVAFHGEQNGVIFGDYKPPELKAKEGEYKLKSTFAHDQLYLLAKELDEMTFCIMMLKIFGPDPKVNNGTPIEAQAYSNLYRKLSKKEIKSPEIIVSKIPINGKLAKYSNKRKKIIVWEKLVKDAIEDNDQRVVLAAALVEEYGHHIDNLLRTELGSKAIPDADIIDEGAKFAYQLFKFDINKQSSLTFAEVESSEYQGSLTIDFSKEQQALQALVNEEQQYDGVPYAEEEEFGAGWSKKNGVFAHGDIEFQALNKPTLFSTDEVYKIYYGNWLRDYSQVIVGISLKPTPERIKQLKQKYEKTKDPNLALLLKAMPTKFTAETWTKIIELMATKEFVYDRLKASKKTVRDNYKTHLKTFQNTYGKLTPEILGVYRPEEHIDNPKGLTDESGFHPKLYKGEVSQSLQIDKLKNMKNYIFKDIDADRPSAISYFKKELKSGIKAKRTSAGFRHIGAALHVLEDYFSHSNFVEISLRKYGASVYPWVEGKEKADYKSIPITTGLFLKDDTAASLLPKIGALLFPPGIKEYEAAKAGERTFSEGLVLYVLEDLANGQLVDGMESDPDLMGLKASTWLSLYNTVLKTRDKIALLKEEYPNASKPIQWISEGGHYAMEILTYLPILIFNLIITSSDDVIKETQSHLKTGYGSNPTHTQLGKDDYEHPLNPLAGKLAIDAVSFVGGMIDSYWKNYSVFTPESIADMATGLFFHPKDNNWGEKIIKSWKDANPKAIERCKSATIFEHAHKTAQKTLPKGMEKSIKEMLQYFKKLYN